MSSITCAPLALAALTMAACAPQPGAEAANAAQSPAGVTRSAEPAATPDAPVASAPASETPTAACDAAKAQSAVGQSYSDAIATEAKTAAGATIVRRLMPGQAVTMEFNGQRLNLETDASGRIVAVRCG